jgi:hypothetical protein
MARNNDRLVSIDRLRDYGVYVRPNFGVMGTSVFGGPAVDVSEHHDFVKERDERRRAERTLKLLLTLEPALERYRKPTLSGGRWDVEGMEKALTFRENEAIAKKYTAEPALGGEIDG